MLQKLKFYLKIRPIDGSAINKLHHRKSDSKLSIHTTDMPQTLNEIVSDTL